MYNNANVSSFIAFSFTLLYSSIAILKESIARITFVLGFIVCFSLL